VCKDDERKLCGTKLGATEDAALEKENLSLLITCSNPKWSV
jgi:hypothetical protein